MHGCIQQKKLPPLCFGALEAAAPHLKKGWSVPSARECPKLYKFSTYWRGRFVAKQCGNNRYITIGPAEQAAIDSLGLTHIVSGMRDGTLGRFNPKGFPGQVMGNSTVRGTKCTICGLVCPNICYPSHLHVDVSGVEGADESGALAAVDSPPEPEPEVCAFWCAAVSVVSLPHIPHVV
jgi:hypothetical protein